MPAASLITDLVLHAFILWTFLALFFFLYISKIEKEAFENEFGNLIDEKVPEMLDKANVATGGKLKPILQANQPILSMFERAYSEPDKGLEAYNKWLKFMAFGVSGLLLLVLIIFLITRWYSCHQTVPLSHIIYKNIFMFVLVAVIEFLFFWFIAKHYTPVVPSQLIKNIVERLEDNFQPKQ